MQQTGLKGAHLSLQQERLWKFQQENNVYYAQSALLLSGALDNEIFKRALLQMVEQHEILQTLFYSLPGLEVPLQVINRRVHVFCPLVDLQGVCAEAQADLLDTCFTFLQEEPFDLVQGPLLRTILFRLAPDRHVFLYNLPALCADEMTLSQFAIQLGQWYDGYLGGEMPSIEPLQYVAVTSWQKKLLQAESAAAAREFWSNFDVGRAKVMPLPFEGAEDQLRRTEIGSLKAFKPHLHKVAIREEQHACIADMARRLDVSVEALLLAWWYIALWRLTGETRVLMGVASNGRNYEELSKVLGLYTRFVPMTISFEALQDFKQVAATVQLSLHHARKWQAYFTGAIEADASAEERQEAVDFPITFEYEAWPTTLKEGNLTISLLRRACCVEPFVLKLSIVCIGERVSPELQYDPRYFTPEQVCRLSGVLEQLLQSMLAVPQASLGSLSMLSRREQESLINAFGMRLKQSYTAILYWRFEEHAMHYPEDLAVVGEDETLSYAQLNQRANRLARLLAGRGVGPNVRVGLCLERSAMMALGLLAIWKAGGAYVALDPQNPPARLADQLSDANVLLVLSQPALCSCLEAWGGTVLEIEEAEAEARMLAGSNLQHRSYYGDEAYVSYTSGSTGKAKGVIITQQNVLNYTHELCKLLQVERGWRFVTVSMLAADLGNTAIFGALASGGCLLVPDYATVMSGEAFARWMEQERGDVLKIVPSHLSMLLASCSSGAQVLPERALILGGEVLPPELLKKLEQLGKDCEVYNHYGPTETTVGVLVNQLGRASTTWKRWKDQERSRKRVPLGEPLGHAQLYVLDRWGNLVPEGVTGEIYIGGASLGLGYVGRREQTAEQFVPNPFAEQAGERLYRTGDLGYYTEGKQVGYVGRLDGQVKIRGYRVELEEVEAVLRGHSNVRDCVVLPWESPTGGFQLRAYILCKQQPASTTEELKSFLRAFIPEYMIPNAYLCVKELPLTPNGKIDRRRLMALGDAESSHASSESDQNNRNNPFAGPRDDIEFRLVQIWEELLQTQPITIFDNFFDKGGHSMLAVSLIAQIRKQFGLDLPLATLFDHKTIEDLAVVLRQQTHFENPTLIALQRDGSKPPFFCVHPSGGTAFCYMDLARCLGADRPFYGIQMPDRSSLEGGWDCIEDMAAYYVAAIKAMQPQGPYLLGGWSSGGSVALEIAQQLRAQGHEVPLLAIIDSRLTDAQRREEVAQRDMSMDDAEVVREVARYFRIPIPDDFYQRDLAAQLDFALKQAREIHGIPVDADLEQVRHFFYINKLNGHLADLYVPRSYQGKIDYFLSEDSANLGAVVEDHEHIPDDPFEHRRLRPWQEIAKEGLVTHLVPGNHASMIEEPHVRVLAEALKLRMDQACPGTQPLLP